MMSRHPDQLMSDAHRQAASVCGEMALRLERRSVRLAVLQDWAARLREAADTIERTARAIEASRPSRTASRSDMEGQL